MASSRYAARAEVYRDDYAAALELLFAPERKKAGHDVKNTMRALLDRDIWSLGHHLIIWHGRRCCHARKPECERCPLNDGLCERNMES